MARRRRTLVTTSTYVADASPIVAFDCTTCGALAGCMRKPPARYVCEGCRSTFDPQATQQRSNKEPNQ